MASDDNLIPGVQAGQGPASRGGYNAAGPDYRQIEQPAQGIQPWHLRGTEGEEAAALGHAFKQFEDIGAGYLDKSMQKSGKEAGAQAGLDPNFKPLTGLAAITTYGDAYDAAAHVSYVNATHTQIEGKMAEIEQDTAGDPVAFQTRADAVGKAIVKNAPAPYQPELQNAIALRTQAGVIRTREQAIQTARSDAWESYTSTVDSRISSALQTAATRPQEEQAAIVQNTVQENRTQLDALVKARAITPERSAILQEDFTKLMGKAVHQQYTNNTVDRFMGLARSGDVEAADRALKTYVSDPSISPEDKSEVTKKYFDEAEQFHKLQAAVYEPQITALGKELVQGKGFPAGQGAYGPAYEAKIHQLFKVGAVTTEGENSLLEHTVRNQVAAIDSDVDTHLVDIAVHGGPKLVPGDPTQEKAANTYFQRQTDRSGAKALSDQWTAAASTFAVQTNIIPKGVVDSLRVGLVSGDPEMAARAALAGERIRAANPLIDPWAKDPKSQMVATELTENLKAGLSPQQAYSTMLQKMKRVPAEQAVLGERYKKAMQDNPSGNADTLRDVLDQSTKQGWFSHVDVKNMPAALQAEYEHLIRNNFDVSQDIERSRLAAARQIATTWSLSGMNPGGPTLTKYSPESLNVPPDVLRADMAAHASQLGFTGDPSELRLVPSQPWTDQTKGRVWAVTHVDPKTGDADALLDHNNRQWLYEVPTSTTDFAAAQNSLREQKLDAARKERASARVMSADPVPGEAELADRYLSGNPQQRAFAGR